MAYLFVRKLIGILHDVLVKLDRFIYLTNFVIVDCSMDVEIYPWEEIIGYRECIGRCIGQGNEIYIK